MCNRATAATLHIRQSSRNGFQIGAPVSSVNLIVAENKIIDLKTEPGDILDEELEEEELDEDEDELMGLQGDDSCLFK